MQVINTNIASLNAQRALSQTANAQQTAMARLSSGLRINTAKDDAAGLAISSSMTGQINGLNQAVRNANDGISLVQVAEGALVEVTDMLQRIRELKTQYENGTNNSTQKGYLDEEFAQLVDEIGGVIETTKFNGLNILSGGSSGMSVQKGWASGDSMTIGIDSLQSTAAITNVTGTIDSDTGSAATTSMAGVDLGEVDAAIDKINESRVKLGSQQNRLESSVSSAKNMAENTGVPTFNRINSIGY